ncbi:MAG: CpsD/CapB family tyrosine-protein kinase [bacterium]|nr:CpsD/CapB family tyrosine-protein kinase [bacterium]
MTKATLITLSDPRSAAAEAFRTLRTNLMFSSIDRPISTLVVTSSAQSDNKSVALANLAVTFAQAGNSTILVDCDLRKPTQHDIWGVDNTRGFTTMLTDGAVLANPPLVGTGVDNLSLLPSGQLPPNPADVLSNRRVDEIIGLLKARAHYILFDCPPVLAATDAALLGHKVDGVLLVVQAGNTRRDDALRARQALERVHVRIIGAALTNAPRENAVSYR